MRHLRFHEATWIWLGSVVLAGGCLYLAPPSLHVFWVSLGLAYLLYQPVQALCRRGVPRLVSASLVLSLSVGLLLSLLFHILPPVLKQAAQLTDELPKILQGLQHQWHTQWLDAQQWLPQTELAHWKSELQHDLQAGSRVMLGRLLTWIPGLLHVMLYVVLVPLLIFLLLYDAPALMTWLRRLVPGSSHLMMHFWRGVHVNLGHYMQGKLMEVVVVGAVSMVGYSLLGLPFALLLGLLNGLLVLVPLVGAMIITLPILLIGFWHWGLTSSFALVLGFHGLVLFLDSHLLVPFLFAETLALHPLAILLAILFFGSVWGFWGMFFAIPLASMLKLMLSMFLFEERER